MSFSGSGSRDRSHLSDWGCLLAGRKEEDPDCKLSILAVAVPPLYRLREVTRFLNDLKSLDKDRIKASAIRTVLLRGADGAGENGGWRDGVDTQRKEEERRNFYVGMTRAREMLTLFKREDSRNPHLGLLKGDSLIERRLMVLEQVREEVMSLRYEPLSLADMYISSAGKYPATHPIHCHLSALEPGAVLSFRRIEAKVGLFDHEGTCVALLSKHGTSKWLDRLDRVKTVQVLGMIQREKGSEAEEHRRNCRVDAWEVPWVEVLWRA